MFRSSAELPALVPVLSRGKHRNARKGACFMEFAAYLAGERWSDHPSCTHPLLSELARQVNDCTSDEHRSRLVPLIPSVIGLTTDDVLVDVRIPLRAARAALPIVAAERQNVMALSVLTGDRLLVELGAPDRRASEAESRRALDQAPHAERWAVQFALRHKTTLQGFRRHSAPSIVRNAVRGIAEACVSNPDEILYDLLSDSIREVESIRGRREATCAPQQADVAPAAQARRSDVTA
jgi:hypothetical protein